MSDLQLDIDAGYYDEPAPRCGDREPFGVTPEESEREARRWFSYESNKYEYGRYNCE